MKIVTNSTGIKLVKIEPGTFTMGEHDPEEAELDERPLHEVTISNPFYIATTQVTNKQYEVFDPGHAKYRGKKGFSKDDDEAVLLVSWEDAVAFCEWLSEKESIPYRLPTEAEWEFCCKAGTSTPFHTGEELSKEYHRRQVSHHDKIQPFYEPVSLKVGETPANDWGLHDMHGLVEEWCHDWYGAYETEDQLDPVGRADGISRVTRGGSHHTDVHDLRSASRMAALPEDRSWYIGFRVVQGELPDTKPLPVEKPPLCMRNVSQESIMDTWGYNEENKTKPIFMKPIQYVRPYSDDTKLPRSHQHHHCPAITYCHNGDLLAIWFNTYQERGREMVILGSRLRRGAKEWEKASMFFDVPDRNMTGEQVFTDDDGTIFHFNGVEAAGTWNDLILVLRTSKDNGATWSKPRLINPHHQFQNQVISCTIKTSKGYYIQCCDTGPGEDRGTSIHVSKDGGKTWVNPNTSEPKLGYVKEGVGTIIAGIHASIVELKDGSLLAFGRRNDINGFMPRSISHDLGNTWTYSASEFPGIKGGQRMVLRRLMEGPLLFISFCTDERGTAWEGKDYEGMPTYKVKRKDGTEEELYGAYVAVSFDEGETWPIRKGLGKDFGEKVVLNTIRRRKFVIDRTHSAPLGYLAATQTPDGMIHVICSRNHYRFNYAWLMK
ncbi:MAG: SUMF1/EgtB/PvdO family nonheme iron enzyme [Candidatus Hodarchaeota archaeon]